jgi:hypothetical protein
VSLSEPRSTGKHHVRQKNVEELPLVAVSQKDDCELTQRNDDSRYKTLEKIPEAAGHPSLLHCLVLGH